LRAVEPTPQDVMLDVGGYPEYWAKNELKVARVDCLNVHAIPEPVPNGHSPVKTLIGDGCALEFKAGSYPIVFSNSVIEHVGDWDAQQRFAQEARRVGQRLWIQTPAYECPIEPHFLMPFAHYLPVGIRRWVVKWLSPWAWMAKPSEADLNYLLGTRLLRLSEMRELFPDCEIRTEKLLGLFAKSYIAVRYPR
jgi:Methyltransferase domain